jgi:hypothetical protein
MGTNLGWNARIDNTMVLDSIIMTTCMSHFQNLVWTLIQCQKLSPSQICLSTNVVHAYLYEAIHLQVIMVRTTLSNKSQWKYA